jgi:hypothetical protein
MSTISLLCKETCFSPKAVSFDTHSQTWKFAQPVYPKKSFKHIKVPKEFFIESNHGIYLTVAAETIGPAWAAQYCFYMGLECPPGCLHKTCIQMRDLFNNYATHQCPLLSVVQECTKIPEKTPLITITCWDHSKFQCNKFVKITPHSSLSRTYLLSANNYLAVGKNVLKTQADIGLEYLELPIHFAKHRYPSIQSITWQYNTITIDCNMPCQLVSHEPFCIMDNVVVNNITLDDLPLVKVHIVDHRYSAYPGRALTDAMITFVAKNLGFVPVKTSKLLGLQYACEVEEAILRHFPTLTKAELHKLARGPLTTLIKKVLEEQPDSIGKLPQDAFHSAIYNETFTFMLTPGIEIADRKFGHSSRMSLDELHTWRALRIKDLESACRQMLAPQANIPILDFIFTTQTLSLSEQNQLILESPVLYHSFALNLSDYKSSLILFKPNATSSFEQFDALQRDWPAQAHVMHLEVLPKLSEFLYNALYPGDGTDAPEKPYKPQWHAYMTSGLCFLMVIKVPEIAIARQYIMQCRRNSHITWTKNIAHCCVDEEEANQNISDALGIAVTSQSEFIHHYNPLTVTSTKDLGFQARLSAVMQECVAQYEKEMIAADKGTEEELN